MAASKTGLPKYTSSSGDAFSARIKDIADFAPVLGAKTLTFEDSPKHVNLIPEWIAANNPAVGGYFVVEDVSGKTVCRFVDASTFTAQFKPA